MQAAAELASEVGAGSVTHRAVAARAGVPLSTTSYFFSSIDELVTEALATSTTDHIDGLDEVGRSVPAHAEDASTAIHEAVQQTLGKDGAEAINQVEFLLAAGRQPELRAQATEFVARLVDPIAEQLGSIGIADADRLAWALVAIGEGATLHRLAHLDVDLHANLEHGVRLLVAAAQLTEDEIDALLDRYPVPGAGGAAADGAGPDGAGRDEAPAAAAD